MELEQLKKIWESLNLVIEYAHEFDVESYVGPLTTVRNKIEKLIFIEVMKDKK